MSAQCISCDLEMAEGVGCTTPVYDDFPDALAYYRIPRDEDEGICHDCNTGPGLLHHPGCDAERCPRCGGQAISCDCMGEEEP